MINKEKQSDLYKYCEWRGMGDMCDGCELEHTQLCDFASSECVEKAHKIVFEEDNLK